MMNRMKKVFKALFLLVPMLCHPMLSVGQALEWGEEQKGVQIGIHIENGKFSCKLHVYMRKTDDRPVEISFYRQMHVFMKRGETLYEVEPASTRLASWSKDFHLLTPASGRHRGMLIRKEYEKIPLGTFIVPKIEPFPPCYDSRVDQCYIEFHALTDFPWPPDTTTVYRSNSVTVDFCQESDMFRTIQHEQAMYMKALLKNKDLFPIKLAINVAADTAQNDLYRGIAGRHLSDLNTEESKDVLYRICVDPNDPGLDDMLGHFFQTKDSRGTQFINKYHDHVEENVRAEIAWAIRLYEVEKHVLYLKKSAKDEIRHVRVITMESLGHFNTNAARKILYAGLHDKKLGVRTAAVNALAEIGNGGSLKQLLAYIERENPNNVGYLKNAFHVAEKLSDAKFDGNVELLRAYIRKSE